MMTHRVLITMFAFTLATASWIMPAAAEDMAIDLSASGAAKQWVFSDSNGSIEKGVLRLDGRTAPTKAVFLPYAWGDVTLKAKFCVEPQSQGVLACGFVVRGADAAHCYYVHYDKGQAILCRSDEKKDWNEIKRVSGLDKPAGTWHEGTLECAGDTIRVSLNGQLLYEAQDATLTTGRIGFYAGQGLVRVKDIVVGGKPKKTEAEFVFPPPPPPMFVHVCTDAGAGGYEAFPDVCRLKDGRLMCVFYAGYGHVALPNEELPKGGRVSYCLSSDEGRTWTDARTLYDGPDDDRDPSIVQLKSGRILCNFFSLQRAEGKEPPWNGLGSWLVYSDDMGATWSDPAQVAETYYCSSPVRQLSDGRLILGLYAEEDGRGWGAVALSEDDGVTWSEVIDIDNNGMPLDAETDIIELRDGTLYAAQRGRGETMAWSTSKDGGVTWSVSEPYGFPGHCPYLHRTRDDIIVMAHRLPKTSLHYSLDECATWSDSVLVDDFIGAYPSMVNLKDGTVLIVYYEEGGGSSIRAKRFLATSEGIKWIPVDKGPVPEAASAGPTTHGEWAAHEVRFLNAANDETAVPARLQIVTEPWNRVVAVPYIVYMPEKDRVLMLVGCDYPHHPEVLFSDDHGATWSEPRRVLFDETGRGIDGLGTGLTYLGDGMVVFTTGENRWVSGDFAETWRELSAVAQTCDGKPWYTWDPLWADRDPTTGVIIGLIETGYAVHKPPEVEKMYQQGHIRFSTDLGKTWTDSIKVPQWKGVDEVALIRAANGDLVAAGRTDIPPSKEGEWLDHFEGISVSFSKDDGRSWSDIEKLYDWGRHHPSLVLMPDDRIVMTYVVRKGYVDTPDGFPQFGVEAVVSADHGRTWDLDHKYILHTWPGSRKDENKWWPSSQATSTVLLPDGSLLTAFGTGYRIQPSGGQEPRDVGRRPLAAQRRPNGR